jgi:hypothetical protein
MALAYLAGWTRDIDNNHLAEVNADRRLRIGDSADCEKSKSESLLHFWLNLYPLRLSRVDCHRSAAAIRRYTFNRSILFLPIVKWTRESAH